MAIAEMTREAAGEMLPLKVAAKVAGLPADTLRALADAGRAPRPIRFNGRVLRWNRATLLDWISQGCPELG